MKIIIKHEFPRKIRYAELYLEMSAGSAYFGIDGNSASWYGRIGRIRMRAITDREYSRLRASLPVESVLEDDGEFVVLKNKAGYEERWFKPRWLFSGLKFISKKLTHSS